MGDKFFKLLPVFTVIFMKELGFYSFAINLILLINYTQNITPNDTYILPQRILTFNTDLIAIRGDVLTLIGR